MTDGYNGWKNRETWNVALWIGNDEGLYHLARGCRHSVHPYNDFAETMHGCREQDTGRTIAHETPDGVRWDDPKLDIEALDAMMEEL